MTNAEIHDHWVWLKKQIVRAEESVEHCLRMGVGTGSMAWLKQLRQEANRLSKITDEWEKKYSTQIKQHQKETQK